MLTLTGVNTYSGGTTINAGTLSFGNTSLGTGNITFGGNSTLQWNGSNTQDVSNKIQAIGSGVTATLDTNGNNVTLASVLSGAGSVIKIGTGALTLTAANTYSGGTTLTTGTLNINNAAAIGTGTFTISAGTTIDNTSGGVITLSNNNAQSWNGDFTFTGTNALNMGTGAVALGASRNVTVSGSTLTVGGVISGATFNLTKSGTGALTLSGANTYTGGATLSAGTLNINNATAVGTGTFTINGGTIDNTSGGSITLSNNNAQTWSASYTFTGTNALNLGTGAVSLTGNPTITATASTLTVGGIISGAHSLTKAGAGTLTLSGANTYSTGTTLSAGQLNINNATAIGTGTFTISGGTIDNTSGGAITLSTNNTQAWNGDFAFAGSNPLNLGTGAVTLGASRTVTTTASTLTVGGVIGDSGSAYSIAKAGAGALLLSGANTYSGGTTLSAGTLDINNASAIGTGTFTISGGTIDNTSGSPITLSTNNVQAWNGNFVFTGTNSLNMGTGAVTLGTNRTVTVNGSTFSVGGVIGDSGSGFSLTKAGAGALTLSGSNTFSGGVTLNAGTLNINNAAALGTGTFTINGGTIDNTSGGAVTLSNNNTQTWGGDFTFAGTNNLNMGTGAITLGGNRLVTTSAGRLTEGGAISGGFSLTKAGSGALILSGNNTYTGGMTLSAGELDINSATALGTGTFTINGGSIDNTSGGAITDSNNNAMSWGGDFSFIGTASLNLGTGLTALLNNRIVTVTAAVLTVGGVISGAFSLTKNGNGTLTLSGANTFTGGATLSSGQLNINNAAAIGTGTFTINGGAIDNTSGGAITLSNNNAQTWAGSFAFAGTNNLNLGTGAVSLTANPTITASAGALTVGGIISGAHSLTKAGAGTLTLSGVNTYSTGTTLSAGTLNINNAAAIGTGTFTINGGSIDNTTGSAITLSNNNSQTWGGNFTFIGTSALNLGAGAVTLGANDQVTTTANTLTVGGVIAGAFSLTKAGSGTLTLTGANTYSAGTTINGGTLLANNGSGSGTGTGADIVNSGGTLGGTGGVTSSITVNSGGTLSAGSGGPSVFATGNVTIAAGGNFNEDLNSSTAGSGYDQLTVTGTVNLTGSTLNLSGTRTVHAGDVITLINNDGVDAVTGTFSGLAEGATVSLNGVNYTISYQGGTGNDVVLTDAAPTVATAAAASPATVTGTTTALSVLGASSAGESNLTYTWAATTKPAGSTPAYSANGTNGAKNSTVTFDKYGNYTFTVTISDGTYTVTSAVNVTVNQTLTTITISPSSATLNENATQQFGATANDQFGAAMASQPSFTWSKTAGIGSIDSAGLYTSPGSSGTATIQAASGGITNTANITINNATPTVATAAAASPATVTGTTTALSVLGADDGGEANLTYTWAATTKPAGSTPGYSANGTNGAKNSTVTFDKYGSYTFTVTISDGTNSTTSAVNVTVNQTFTSITVSPSSATLNENATQQFSATANDQFGAAMASQPSFTWTKTAGIGSIDSAGLYTSPGNSGTATIQAASGGITNTANITINNATPTVATAAAASPATVTGTTTDLSVLGADDGGESNLTYTWSATTKPAGSTPGFSANGTNGSKNSTVTFDKYGSYTFTVTISDGTNSTTSAVNVTVNQTFTTITITPSSATLNENTTQQFSATANDQFGAAMASQPSFTWTKTAGIGSIDSAGLYTSPGASGTATIQAASGGITNTANITINNATPTVATAAAASPATVTGTTTDLSVLGADDGGEANLTYTWAATTKPAGSTPGYSANGTNGAKNSTVTFDKYGSYTFTVTISDGSNSTTSQVNVTVNQTFTTITISPSSATLNENATQQFGATANDQFGAAMASQPSFTWTKTAGIGSIDSAGLYTSPGASGTATIQAASGGITNTANITINNATPTVATAAAASPATVTGTTTALSVLGADDGGESNLTYTWAATTKPAGSTPGYSANGTNGAKNSTVTFDKYGSYTFTVTISDGTNSTTSAVNVTVNQTFTTITISPSSVTLNENATQQFSATANDQFGAAMASQPSFTWTKTAGIGSIDSAGLYTSPGASGTATIQAASGGITNTANITINNATPTVATAAAASPATVTGTTTDLSVLGADDGGEANLTYTWAATTKPGGSTPGYSANGTNGAKNSTVTFDKYGSYTFTVTISDGTNSTTSAVNVTVNQTFTTITVSPSSATLNENATQQFSATANDQFGAAMASQPSFTWSKTAGIGSIDSSGLYTSPGASGTATIQATSGGITNTASITINNATPTVATAAVASPATVTGTTTDLSVLGADDGGEANLTYTWAATTKPAGSTPGFSANGTNGAKASTVTFDKYGNYTFTVTISDGTNSTTSAVNVTVNQTFTSITISPSSVTLNENATQQFGATANDQFGAAMASQPSFTWTKTAGIGSIDSSGLYTAPGASGTATIQATSGGITNTASITINNATPTVATAAAASPATVTGTTTDLSVLGADDGGESNLTYTWAATAKPAGSTPGFSANGTNGSKNSTVTFDKYGSYTFTVTISDGTNSTTSAVNVTVNQIFTTITISPSSATLNENATQQFSATANDQFGAAMASQPSFTWTKTAGIGSIDSSGLYTAPGASGTATIQAASGGITNTANITINNATPTVATAAAASPATVTGTTTNLSVLGADDGGEANLTYTWAATTKPAGSTPGYSANGTNGAKASTVTFDKYGSYTFTVTISDGTNSTTSAVNVTVNQTFTTITISPSSATLNENATQQFSATANDQFGAAMASQPSFTWSKTAGIGSIDAAGLYTSPGVSGTATIQAASGGITNTANITINNATPTVATAAAASPATVTGTTTDLSVLGADDGGEANLTYTWAATTKPAGSTPGYSANGTNGAKASTVTFDKYGSYTFTVTISDGTNNTTSQVSVTVNQTLTSITVSPSSQSLNENATQQFTASAFDQFGVLMASQPSFTWSKTAGIGSIDSSGLYTAPGASGSATIEAASGAVTGTASITINNATPTVATAAAAAPATVTGTTTDLSVLGADDGGEANLTYTWAATTKPAGSTPGYSANGTNGAKASTVTFDKYGSYTFTVTISDGTNSTTSQVNVTVNQTLTTITVLPGTATLNENATQQFSATGYDQFGLAMAVQPSFTWSKTAGIGGIDSSGLYTSPGSSGTATVQAASGSINNTAAITINNATPTVATAAAAAPATVTGTTTDLSVLGADDGGESNLTYTWAATTKPAGSTPGFSANATNGAKNSTVTFDKAGSYTFTVTISDGNTTVTSAVNVTVNQTLTTISLSPSSSSLNENATQQFTATGYDQFSIAMLSQPSFTWTRTAGVGSIDAAGLYTAPGSTGTATVQAASGSITGTASIIVHDQIPTVATAAAASPATVTGTTTDLSVLGADDGGEANLTYTWAATTKPAGSTPAYSANGSNGAKNSTVTFDKYGSYTFTVTISDGTNSTTSAVNVTVNQTFTSITVSPSSATLNENATQQFSATANDQFGAAMASQPSFTWTKTAGIGSIDSAGLYTSPGNSGTATIQAASGGITNTANITINNATPTVATAAAASPATVTGTTTDLSVLGADDGGESNLTYTWSATTKPAGSTPGFSANGTNGSKNSTVTFDKYGSYTFTVTISDGTNSTTSAVNVTVNQTFTTITITPSSATLNENATQQFSATANDQFGAAMASQPSFTWTKTAGIGSIDSSGLYTSPGASGTAIIQAASGGITNTASITINNATPTVATAAAASPATVTGTTTDLSVLGADDGGEANLTYTWATTTKPAGSTPAYSANGTNGSKNSTVTFDKYGSYTFTVTISDGTNSTTSQVNVTVNQTFTSITISPSSATLNENSTQQFSATANDQFGAAMASQPSFTWTKTAGIGSIDSAGLYTSPGASGTATIQAASGGITNTANITINNATPTVATAAAASPATVTGTTTDLSVLGADDGGEANLTYTWAATTKPAGSTPGYSANGTNGAKASTVTFDKYGSYTFTVTISDGTNSTTSAVNVTVNQTFTTITITPSSATLNENSTQQFSATANDQFGAAMASQPSFTWTKTAGIGSIDSAGLYTSPGSSGTATIQAASGGITNTANITINNATPTVATAAAASPATVTGTTTDLSVLGADDGGEANLTYTWAATTKPAGSTPAYSANGTNGAKNSTVTFDKYGSYTFTVTISDGTNSTTSAVNVTVNQTFTTITISPSSATLNENATQQFAATANDQFGAAMASQPSFAWTKTAGIGGIDSSGLYTAPGASGSATIQAASGGITNTASITINNATPTVATAAAASPATVTGTTTALSVLGADDGGEANLTYTWAATTKPAGSTPAYSANGTNGAKNSTVTFDKYGSYTFTVTISDGTNSTTSAVNVTVNQTFTTITITPSSATLNENATQQFAATANDQFGAAMASQPSFTWSKTAGIGSIDSAGLYTSPGASGTATIQAASGGIINTANITINNATPTVATAAAASPATVTGTTTDLSVLGADDGGEANLTYTWAATTKPAGSTPGYSANGTNGAKNSTVTFDKYGSYTFTVTISDGTNSTTSQVNVTVNQTFTAITITPSSATLNENATQQFSATANDQFGAAMASQPSFTWSKTAGIGSIDSAGLYTSPGSSGTATIQAASGGITNTANITINNATPTVATAAAASPATVTGTTTDLSVLGADDGGEANLTYTWAATTKPAGSTPGYSANGTNGAKASTVTFDKYGSYTFTITISDGTNSVTSQVSVTVNQTFTSITVSPSSATLNENVTQQFGATANDQFGAAMASQPSFTWTKTAGIGSIDSSGLYTSPGASGTATIQAASGGITNTANITINNATPTVATAAAASPATVTGTTTDLSVLGADDGGEANLTYTWAATTKPAGSTPGFSANGTNAAKASTVTFDKYGSYTFTVTISDGTNSTTSAVNVTVNQTFTTITISPSSATLNENATQQFSATANDQFGAAMASQPSFTWSKTAGIGSIDSSGLYTSPGASGTATIQAASGGITNTANITINNATPTVATAAAASPATVTGTTTDLSVLGADDGGEANLTYTWAATTKPAGSTPGYSANGTNGSKNSTVTFDKYGSYTFTVTISDGTNSTTSAVNVTVNQTFTSITVTPAGANLPLQATQQFAATAYDQFGLAMSSQPAFAWSTTSVHNSINSAGLFTAGITPGNYTVTATSASISGNVAVIVTDNAPTVAIAAAATPATVTTTTTALSVLGADDGGEANLTYTWAATTAPAGANAIFSANGTNGSKNSTVTFNKPGSYTFTVTISDGTSNVTSSVNVLVVSTLTTITVSPTSPTMNENASQQFIAVGLDQFGVALATQPVFTWTKIAGIGAIDSISGNYTAPGAPGTATIQAASGSVSARTTLTVNNAGPTVATAAAASPVTVIGTTTNLSVLGADDGGESKLIYTWAATTVPSGARPGFSAAGTNGAKNAVVTFDKAGVYVFTVTISDGTSTATSSVSVTVNQTLTAVSINPSSATVNASQTQLFVAGGIDQFGAAMPLPSAVTWSLDTNSMGTLSATGAYTAPNEIGGSAIVRATLGAITATAAVTIQEAQLPAPQNLIGGALSGTQVQLNWSDSSVSQTGFAVERSYDGTTWNQIASVPAAASSYFDGGVSFGGTYFYRVRAVRGSEVFAPSNVVIVGTPSAPPPAFPGGGTTGGTTSGGGSGSGSTSGGSGSGSTSGVIDPGGSSGTTSGGGSSTTSGGTGGNNGNIGGTTDPNQNGGSTTSGGGSGGHTLTPGGTKDSSGQTSDTAKSDTSNNGAGTGTVGSGNAVANAAVRNVGQVGGSPEIPQQQEPVIGEAKAGANPSDIRGGRSSGNSQSNEPSSNNAGGTIDRSILTAQIGGRLIAPPSIEMAQASANAYSALEGRDQLQEQAVEAAKEVTAQKTQQQVVARVAASVTATAVAGYLVWLVQGGSLLMSVISTLPFWGWFDPLPVLDSWEKGSAGTTKSRWYRRSKPKVGTNDEKELEGIVD